MSGFDNLSETVRTVSATGAVAANDYDVLVIGATAAVTLTLPAVANLAPGRVFRIYKDAAAFAVTIAPAAGTIDGAANISLAASAKHAATVLTDGTNWFTVASY